MTYSGALFATRSPALRKAEVQRNLKHLKPFVLAVFHLFSEDQCTWKVFLWPSQEEAVQRFTNGKGAPFTTKPSLSPIAGGSVWSAKKLTSARSYLSSIDQTMECQE